MTNREEYVAELKVRLDRCNAAIGRSSGGDKELTALREQRERLLAKLRELELAGPATLGAPRAQEVAPAASLGRR